MNIEELKLRYKLSENDLDAIAAGLMEDISLENLHKLIGSKITKEKLFVAAKLFCKAEFGELIEEMSPQITIDRISMFESGANELRKRNLDHQELKKLRAVEDDMRNFDIEKQKNKG